MLTNVYAPSLNLHSAPDRPNYRAAWDEAFREYVCGLPKLVIIAGDFNTTRAWIDSYPENQKNVPDDPFFQPETRERLEEFLASGFVDVCRAFYPQKTRMYTWWGPKNSNRADNRGSRLDYFIVSAELLPCVKGVKFYTDNVASDHCPIAMKINSVVPKQGIQDENLAAIWRNINIKRAEWELFQMQKKSPTPRTTETGRRKDASPAGSSGSQQSHAGIICLSLAPVSESTADPRSFFSWKGRSLQDVHAYLIRDLRD